MPFIYGKETIYGNKYEALTEYRTIPEYNKYKIDYKFIFLLKSMQGVWLGLVFISVFCDDRIIDLSHFSALFGYCDDQAVSMIRILVVIRPCSCYSIWNLQIGLALLQIFE